jgi:ketosteroid isomerase-like protein
MRKLVLLALIAGATGACQDAGSPTDANEATAPSEASLHRTHHDLRDARATLTANANELSAAIGRHGVANAIGRALTRDALFLGPRSNTLQGREAAVNYLTTNPIAPSAIRWETIVTDVSADGQRGYTWLEGILTIDLGAGPTEQPGFLLAFWDRRDYNDWKISAFVFNLGGPQTDPIPDGFGTPDTRRSRKFDIRLRKERGKLLEVDAAFSAMSVSDGSGPAFEAFAAPNAIAVGDPALVFGPAAIGAASASGPDDVISWVPRFSDVAESGDLGFTVGDATFNFPAVGTFYSKYLTIWRKQKNGEWKFVADLGNSRPAPAP